MKKKNSLFLFFLALVACASKGKPISPKTVYKTDYGFEFRVPMKGELYQGKADFYVFGTKPKEDGSTILFEVRHGFIYKADDELEVNREILKTVFEPALQQKKPEDRVEVRKVLVAYRHMKTTECMNFKQTGFDKEKHMDISYNGMICLLPENGNKYVWMGVSQFVPQGKPFINLEKDEKDFFETLKFQY